MTLNKLIKMSLCTAACVAGTAFAAPVELVVNGSFEADAQAPNTWHIYNNLTGWTGGIAGIELRDNNAGQAYDGKNFIELDTNKNSSAAQTIATVAGHDYILSFAYSPRAGVKADSNGIDVLWNGHSLGVQTGDGMHNTGNVWSIITRTVHATSNTSTLMFSAAGKSDSYGGSLDRVSLISSVPEPSTYAMMLAGVGMLGLASRRRRNGKFSA